MPEIVGEDNRADTILRDLEVLRKQRQEWNSLCQRVNAYFSYFKRYFYEDTQIPYAYLNTEIVDDRPPVAASRFADHLSGKAFPSDIVFFALKAANKEIGGQKVNQIWIQNVEEMVASVISHPLSNFQPSINLLCKDIALYGAGAMTVEMGNDRMPKFMSIPIEQCYYSIYETGEVDVFIRRYKLGWREAKQRYEKELRKALSGDKYASYEKNELDSELEFVISIRRNNEHKEGQKGSFPYEALTILAEERNVLDKEGFYSFPVVIARWKVEQGSQYPSSPAMNALASASEVNQHVYNLATIGTHNAHPPLVVANQGSMGDISRMMGTMGGIIPYNSSQGNARNDMFFLPIESDTTWMTERLSLTNDLIQKIFYLDIFEPLPPAQSPRGAQTHMSAREVDVRYQSNLSQLAPILGSFNNQTKGRMVRRIISMLYHYDKLPAAPSPELITEGGLEIVYKSYMEEAFGLYKVDATSKLIQSLREAASVAPGQEAERLFKILNMPVVVRGTADALRVPPEYVKTPEEIAEMEQQEAQDKALMQQDQQGLARSQQAENYGAAEKAFAQARAEPVR